MQCGNVCCRCTRRDVVQQFNSQSSPWDTRSLQRSVLPVAFPRHVLEVLITVSHVLGTAALVIITCVCTGTPETLQLFDDNSVENPFIARFKNWGSPPFKWKCAGKWVR